jgi:hypothetical protein
MNIYVFTNVIPALTLIILTITDNNVTIKKAPEGIISETAYTALILAATQTRNNFIDFMTV